MNGEVEHTGAVERGDLDQLTPQHLGSAGGADEDSQISSTRSGRLRPVRRFGGRAGNRHSWAQGCCHAPLHTRTKHPAIAVHAATLNEPAAST